VNGGPGADNDLYLRLAATYPLYYSTTAHVACRLHAGNLTHRWGVVQQATGGFYTLRKIFADPALPEELRAYRNACYAYYCRKVIARREKLFQRGDVETARELTRLLRENGCKD
jgi:hypothetical protein